MLFLPHVDDCVDLRVDTLADANNGRGRDFLTVLMSFNVRRK